MTSKDFEKKANEVYTYSGEQQGFKQFSHLHSEISDLKHHYSQIMMNDVVDYFQMVS